MKFELDGVIKRHPDEVFSFITNMEEKHEWVEEVISSRQTSEGPLGVGTIFVDTVTLMGRTFDAPHVITRYEPNRQLSYRTTSGPLSAELNYTLGTEDSGTRLKVAIEAELPWYFKVLGPALKAKLGKQMDGNFSALKKLLEQQIQVKVSQSLA